MFNFADHAAKATENLGTARDTSIRMLEGVRIVAEISELVQKTGINPATIKSKGEYNNAVVKFVIRGVERLADTTDKQLEFAKQHIGHTASLVWKLFGDPSRPAFGERNGYTLRDMLSLTHAAMANNVATVSGVEAAKQFKSPFFQGNYPSEEDRQKAVVAVGSTLDGAFKNDEAALDMLIGSKVIIDVAPGKPKDEKDESKGRYYNIYFKPYLDVE